MKLKSITPDGALGAALSQRIRAAREIETSVRAGSLGRRVAIALLVSTGWERAAARKQVGEWIAPIPRRLA